MFVLIVLLLLGHVWGSRKSNPTKKIKDNFSQAMVSCQFYYMDSPQEKKLNSNCTRMLRAILNKSWKQHPTKQKLHAHLPLISKTIQISQTRHVGHCWRSKDGHISDDLLWTLSHRCASVGRSTRTYLQLLCTDTGCSLEDLLEAIYDRDEWREREREWGKSVLAV